MDTHEDWVRETKLGQLRQQLKLAIDQLDAGEGKSIDSRDELERLFREIKED